VVASDGVTLRAADGSFQLRLRGYVQDDGRMYQGVQHAGTSTFLMRRVRPIFEATALKRYTLRFMPDFGNGQTVVYDAYIDAAFLPQLGLRFGKFKPPVGLERLQSATNLMFVERGLPTSLVPNRDIGVQLQGALGEGTLTYAIGAFNGVNDGSLADGDSDNDKEMAARLFVQPFLASESDALRGLGFGMAATRGAVHGTLTTASLPSYSSPGQLAFFRYRSDGKATGTAIASGEHVRLSPQGWYYVGPLGVLGEYVESRQAVILNTSSATLRNRAWQVAASYAVTGEDANAKGIRPRTTFDPSKGSWGALELTARVHELRVDDAAFPIYADSTVSARSARAWAAGLNWYLNPNVKLVLDYERTRFAGGAKTGDRAPERALFSRIQFAF
jgi:phosphate-selective porin OprO/OprP